MLQTNAGRSFTEVAYVNIRRDILACRLPPGEKIKINDLAKRHDVSVQAAREALSRLTSDGLVIAEAQKGFRVAPISRAHLEDLTSTRIQVELTCLRRAIELGSVDWEGNILAALHRLSRTPERLQTDPDNVSEEWIEAHKTFHAALVAACDSPIRLHIREALFDQSERYRRLSIHAMSLKRDQNKEHQALANAALARNQDLSARLMTEHLNTTAKRLLPLAESDRNNKRKTSIPKKSMSKR